jgi:hypothetical protein
MVQCSGTTYRIMKIGSGSYEVVRILDDVRMGTFDVSPRLRVRPENGAAQNLLVEIALTALKEAKLSWTAHVRSVLVPPVPRDSSGLVGP